MKWNSITFKLLFFIILTFIITTISVLVLSDLWFISIIDESQEFVYGEKIDTILGNLKIADERLRATGMVEAYSEDFKESAIQDLRQNYYTKENQIIYPFIIDKNGVIVMHPFLEEGDLSLREDEGIIAMLSSESGFFHFNRNGQKDWGAFKEFASWDWVIGYRVPLEQKYRDAEKFRAALIAIMAGIAFLTLMVLIWIITKFTKPIVDLTRISTQIAGGKLDQKITFKGSDEVGTLAHSFDNMRDAIKRQIAKLNVEISERKRAEDALLKEKEFTETALNTQQDTFFLFEPATGKAIRWNQAFNKITGYTDEEISGMKAPDSYYSPEDMKRTSIFTKEILKAGTGTIELDLICKDGRKVPSEYSVSAIKDADGKSKYFISIGRDITERKKAEEKIKNSLQEKEVLVQEVNHRVKNNLNVLTSMLGMQQRTVKNREVVKALAEYEARLSTMALLHNHLTQSEDLAKINMKEFFEQLAEITTATAATPTTSAADLELEIKMDDIIFPVDIATPCGLIVNELITNSMKYAFKDGKKNKITVSMTISKVGTVILIVSDNGVGIPEGFDIEKIAKTGLNLVKILSERQLLGSYEVKSDRKGTSVNIKFKKDLV